MSEIRVDVDNEGALNQMEDMINAVKGAATYGALKGAQAIADRAGHLMAEVHPPGTKTPSLPGTPPARISGRLAESITAHTTGPGEAAVGPHDVVYADIQEFGGYMTGHPEMHWIEDGIWHKSAGHSLPPRPYMGPARDSELHEIKEIVADEIQHAIDFAAGE